MEFTVLARFLGVVTYYVVGTTSTSACFSSVVDTYLLGV